MSSAAGFVAAPGLQRQMTAGTLQQQLPPGTMQSNQGQATGYGNGNGMLPHRSQTLPFQHQQQPSLNNTTHTHRASTPGAMSISSASESLDPMDFPALGASAPTAVNSSLTGVSYASQAGQQQGTIGGGRERSDFGPDDFPALGGGGASAQMQQVQDLHPPGLNGFAIQPQQNIPGVLSLPSRNVQHPGFQQQQHTSETENSNNQKRYATLKNAQQAQAAWNNSSPTHHHAQPIPGTNGQTQAQGHLGAVSAYNNGMADIPSHTTVRGQQQIMHSQQMLRPQQTQQHPQTPAQQILVSAADRWGLLGLLAMIKNSGKEPDGGLSTGVGTDLGTMGLDVGYSG